MTTSSLRDIAKLLIYFAALGSLVAAAAAFFPSERLGSDTYLEFVLQQGPLFTLSFSFLSVIWSDLDKNEGLVSADPVQYVSACLFIVAGVFHAMGGALGGSRRRSEGSTECKRETDTDSAGSRSLVDLLVSTLVIVFEAFFYVLDTFIGLFMFGLLLCVSLLWLLLVAPPLYFVTLVSGAVARLSLRKSRGRALVVRELGRWLLETETGKEGENTKRDSQEETGNPAEHIQDLGRRFAEAKAKYIEKGLPLTEFAKVEAKLEKMKKDSEKITIDVTLSRKPVSLTSAISSILLWLANPITAKLLA